MYMTGENPTNKDKKIGHLEGSILNPLRASKNWQKLYETQKWGIVSSEYKLPENTTITILELNPDCINNESRPRTKLKPLKPCTSEFRILTRFWTDWFIDMGVSSNNIYINKTSNNLNEAKKNLDVLFPN